jgi:site-specific recombinase XerD
VVGGMPQLWGPARRRPVTRPHCLLPRNQAMGAATLGNSGRPGGQGTRCAETVTWEAARQASARLGAHLRAMPGTLALTQEQEAAVRATLAQFPLRDQALAELLLGSGYRVTEALSLSVADVWAVGRVKPRVTVRRAQMKGGRSPWKRRVTARSVPLNSRVVAALEAYLFSRFGSAGPANSEEPLFPSRSGGGRLSRWRVNQIVHQVLEAAGIDSRPGTGQFGTHSLRKTFCKSVYRLSNNDLALTRIAMSHASIQTTQAYLPIATEDVDRIVMGLGAQETLETAAQGARRKGT